MDSKKTKEEALLDAAKRGNMARVEQILSEGISPDSTDKKGITALFYAVGRGHTGAIQVLIKYGANPNARDKNGNSPLHEAAQNGYTEAMKMLLEAGADPNTSDSYGVTPLHDAAICGHHKCVAQLLAAGADANSKNKGGKRADEVIGKDFRYGKRVSAKERKAIMKVFEEHKASQDQGAVPTEVDLGGPEMRALYDRACEEGVTEVYSTRFVLIGKYGNGKTNLVGSLMGEDFEPDWKITDGIAIHPCVMTKTQQWKKIEGLQDQFPYVVAEQMKKLQTQKRGHEEGEQSKTSQPEQHVEGPADSEQLDTPRGGVEKIGKSSSTEVLASEELPDLLKEAQITDKPPEAPESFLTAAKILQEKDAQANPTGTREHPQISIWDFGGQEIFYSTQQVFYTHRAIYGLTLNLAKPLHAPVDSSTVGGGPASQCIEERDFIDYHLESIRAHTRPLRDEETTGKRDIEPPVVVIGTHSDQVTKESKEEYHSSIRRHLKGRLIDKHVRDRYFFVDNTKRNPEDPEVTNLRHFILDIARQQSYMGEKIPIKWLELRSKLLEMYKQGTRYCNMERVMEAMGTGVTSEDNAIGILQFLHLRGDIIFFPTQSLRNFVILDPQWLVDVCKTIITIPLYRDPAVKEEWDRLKETGELTDRLIEYVWTHRKEALQYNLIEYKQELLDIMDKFDLVLQCHGYEDREKSPGGDESAETTYFVPSLLTTEPDFAKLYPPGIARSKPIFIVFDGKFCPVGLYHRLVICCMRRHSKVKPQLAYARCARFITTNRKQTFLVTKERFYLRIELLSSVKAEASRFSHGPSVKEGLDEDLKELIHKWIPGISYKWCLRCSCESHEGKEDAERFLPITEASVAECFSDGEVVCETYAPATATSQDIGLADWFQDPYSQGGNGWGKAQPAPLETSDITSPLAAVPSLQRCFNIVVRDACPKWRELGHHLDLPSANIDEIEERYRGDPRKCCRAVCDRWVQVNGSRATIQRLRDALVSIREVPTVEAIDDMLQLTEDTSKSSKTEPAGVTLSPEVAPEDCFPVIVEDVCPRWTELSRQLGLTEAQVDQVSEKHQGDPRECCWEALKLWIQMAGKSASVESLKDALVSAEEIATAEKLATSFRK
ncbi:death-associated protein kinase 1-like [Branchiostoma floridae]|uniref:Death-associated protein kinase 1-like n=1 Tax=Branchiostoma floridae TaxID=7739 RepID=A0A9J7MJU3_BRAFL|nr:death-associated protein kinase 1-like [Branchiostoma floridae]